MTKRSPHRPGPPFLRWMAILLLVPVLLHAADRELTNLDRYVAQPDDSFAWKLRGTMETNGMTLARLELTSQTWRGIPWSHELTLIRPAQPRHEDIAFLYITGDRSGSQTLRLMTFLAARAGVHAAVLTRVPNQPLFDGRKEDALIAYTFDRFARTGETDWPLLYPMAKSAVRAMDALTDYQKETYGKDLTRFVVGGASKRGWTTWLTAAVDQRVVAMAPMVIDMLNMKAQINWAEKVYGKQSEQIHDYTDLRLHLRLDEPRIVELRNSVDPYHYRDRYTMPKLILLGTNDPYWTVDALRHYWGDLPGGKFIFQTPNAGHDLAGGEQATRTLAAFLELIADRQPLPDIKWSFQDGPDQVLQAEVHSNQKAKAIRLWTAHSADRDFRNDAWSSQDLDVQGGSSHAETTIEKPGEGYRASMLEVELTTPRGLPYKLSTIVRVHPDTAP